jgi:hypothetical protein
MPVLANIAGEKELIEGGELLIHCYVLMGNPKPRIEWLRDVEKLVKLKVHYPPGITLPLQTSYNLVGRLWQLQVIGDSITISCWTEKSPAPETAWYLNGVEYEERVLDKEGGLILDIAKEEHGGEWKCAATNALGTAGKGIG